MMTRSLLLILLLYLIFNDKVPAQQMQVAKPKTPLALIEVVADKIVRETDFALQLELQTRKLKFDFEEHVDFGRTFGKGKAAVGYALSEFISSRDTSFRLQLSHSDGLTIWINGQVVYQKRGTGPVKIQKRERDLAMEHDFPIQLKRGANQILIRSETQGRDWIFYLQPQGALIEERRPQHPELTIRNLPGITPEVAALSNWLILGPFPPDGPQPDILSGAPFAIGKLYGKDTLTSWTIPKVELFANISQPKPYWGVYYNWNYHTGGVAWAMSKLTEATGNAAYDRYAKRWSDFMLDKRPFIGYQLYTLHGFQSTHHQLFDTPLLDFTAAPTLPIVYRLAKYKEFSNRQAYLDFYKKVKDYVIHKQIRTEEGSFTRETPRRYTTWVDDMFMGIPFLVQSALETADSRERSALLDDAAKQVVAFNQILFDPEARLYQHVQYSGKKLRIPFWSRANGWGIWATTELLLVLPKSHPLRASIMKTYRQHIDALTKLQDPRSGAWHNVLDRPDSYEELSGTAIFALNIARGINEGWLEKRKYLPNVQKAWSYLASCIEPDGTVHQICVGTMSSENVKDYMDRPYTDNDSHGIFGLIIAGIEIEKLFRGQ